MVKKIIFMLLFLIVSQVLLGQTPEQKMVHLKNQMVNVALQMAEVQEAIEARKVKKAIEAKRVQEAIEAQKKAAELQELKKMMDVEKERLKINLLTEKRKLILENANEASKKLAEIESRIERINQKDGLKIILDAWNSRTNQNVQP